MHYSSTVVEKTEQDTVWRVSGDDPAAGSGRVECVCVFYYERQTEAKEGRKWTSVNNSWTCDFIYLFFESHGSVLCPAGYRSICTLQIHINTHKVPQLSLFVQTEHCTAGQAWGWILTIVIKSGIKKSQWQYSCDIFWGFFVVFCPFLTKNTQSPSCGGGERPCARRSSG